MQPELGDQNQAVHGKRSQDVEHWPSADKSRIPRVAMLADAMAIPSHSSPGSSIPKKNKATVMKPMMEIAQKTLANTVAVF